MPKSPEVLILQAPGLNAEHELSYAFEKAGAKPSFVHISELREKSKSIQDFAAVGIPGGFSYGDVPRSGALLGLKLEAHLAEEFQRFLESGERVVLGICNGNQILVSAGLLPFGTLGDQRLSLAHNSNNRFECRQVNLRVEKQSRAFNITGGMDDIISVPVAHGEGRYFAPNSTFTIQRIEDDELVVARYVDLQGNPTQEYLFNPNGSANAIAALTDPKGQVIGFMPHPERATTKAQYPNWRRTEEADKIAQGLKLFKGIVTHVSQM